MLASRIFEHNEDVPDLIRLLSGPDFAIEIDPSAPSEYYSFILADLARQRGFDGFLLNFEQSLPGGAKQANALSKWVRHLREELWKKVGPHAEGIWCARSHRELLSDIYPVMFPGTIASPPPGMCTIRTNLTIGTFRSSSPRPVSLPTIL